MKANNPINQSAVIYQRQGTIIIGPENRTTDGLWLDRGPYQICDDSTDESVLGAMAKSTLRQSQLNVPHPTSWTGATKALEAAAGVKSYRTFISGAVYVSLHQSNQGIQLVPSTNGGATGDNRGFHPKTDQSIMLDSSISDSSLGKKIRSLLMNKN